MSLDSHLQGRSREMLKSERDEGLSAILTNGSRTLSLKPEVLYFVLQEVFPCRLFDFDFEGYARNSTQ